MKRFSATKLSDNRMEYQKIDDLIQFPMELDMTPYSTIGESATYKLYAICNHFGSLDKGHYTAFAKHKTTNECHNFNDTV